jgi:hypothetical protein
MPVWAAILLLLAAVAGRSLKLRIGAALDSRTSLRRYPAQVQRALLRWRLPFADSTAIALSFGGVLVPLGFSVCVLLHQPPGLVHLLVASVLVAGVTEFAWSLALRGAAALPLTLMPVMQTFPKGPPAVLP